MALPSPPERSIGKTFSRKASKLIRTFFLTNDSESINLDFTHPIENSSNSTRLHKITIDSEFIVSAPATFNNDTIDFNFDDTTVLDIESMYVNIGASNGSSTVVNFSTNTNAEDSDTNMFILGTSDIQGSTHFRATSELFISDASLDTTFGGDVTFTSAISVDSDTSANTFDSELRSNTFTVTNLRATSNAYFGDSDSDNRLILGTDEILFRADKAFTVCGVTGTLDSDILLPNGLVTQFFDIRN
jgi:hypothetical protein